MRNAIKPDYYINIDVKGNNTFSFTNAEEIHDLGYRQVKTLLLEMDLHNYKYVLRSYAVHID